MLTRYNYIADMQDLSFEPRPKVAPGSGAVRWIFKVHVALAVLWALLNVAMTGGVVLIGDFAGATVDVDPPEGGFRFPIGLLLVLLVPTMVHIFLAWGTRRRAPWARRGTIAIGLVTMLAFPIGTLIGLYVVWQGSHDWPPPDGVDKSVTRG